MPNLKSVFSWGWWELSKVGVGGSEGHEGCNEIHYGDSIQILNHDVVCLKLM